jgi:replicative DNA helicase
MIQDITLLQLMKHRDAYEKYYHHVKKEGLNKQGDLILEDLVRYFNAFPNETVVNIDQFVTLFFQRWHINLSEQECKDYREKLFPRMMQESGIAGEQLVEQYNKQVLFEQIRSLINRNAKVEELQDLLDKKVSHKDNSLFVPMDITERGVLEDRSRGLRWRMNVLNEGLAPLILGDFGVVAARPDTGKTSFLASEVTHMAAQLPEGKQVLWFNNEWLGYEIRGRIYQAALNAKVGDITQDLNKARENYKKVMGSVEKIQVVDVHKKSYRDIENIIKKVKPGLVIIDMLDHIRGFANKDSTETVDAIYDRMYSWASDLSCVYCPVLGTSQVSSLEGLHEDVHKWTPMDYLKGSKTAKQGAARFILMLGCVDKEQELRYLSAPKNKLRATSFKALVKFDKHRARYYE